MGLGCSARPPTAEAPVAAKTSTIRVAYVYVCCLSLSSFLLLVAAAHATGRSAASNLSGEDTWAILCPILSMTCLLIRSAVLRYGLHLGPITYYCGKEMYTVRLCLSGYLACSWVSAAFVLTFIGPFTEVGNGYIAAYAGMASAIGLLMEEHEARRKAMEAGPTVQPVEVEMEGGSSYTPYDKEEVMPSRESHVERPRAHRESQSL